jgi:hypothetical protein
VGLGPSSLRGAAERGWGSPRPTVEPYRRAGFPVQPERKLRAAAEVKKALEIQCDAFKHLSHVGPVLSHDLVSHKPGDLVDALRPRRPIS